MHEVENHVVCIDQQIKIPTQGTVVSSGTVFEIRYIYVALIKCKQNHRQLTGVGIECVCFGVKGREMVGSRACEPVFWRKPYYYSLKRLKGKSSHASKAKLPTSNAPYPYLLLSVITEPKNRNKSKQHPPTHTHTHPSMAFSKEILID